MNWNKWLVGSALVGAMVVAGSAGQALACPDCWSHNASWTGEDQAKADEIREPYAEDLSAFETRLRAKSRELGRAVAADDASKAAALRGELADLERAYGAVRADLRDDLRQAGLAGHAGTAAWTCRWHDDHGWRDESRGHRAARPGGHSGRGGCCW